MPEGSWKCEKCNNINYPFRTKCNRQNCGADKPSETKSSPPEAADANDQVCCLICLLHLILYLNLFAAFVLLSICNKTNSIYTQGCNPRVYFHVQFILALMNEVPTSFCFRLFMY